MSDIQSLMVKESKTLSTELASLQSSSFIPSLGIAYGTSKSVLEDRARVGEFVLGGQTSLGKTIEAVIVDWRLHSTYVEKGSGTMNGDAWHFPRTGSSASNTEYQNFLRAKPPENHDLKEGADVFLWIPSQTMFGLFFMKGSLAKLSKRFVDAGNGMRLLTINTVRKEWPEKKLNWFEITWQPQNVAVVGSPLLGVEANISVPEDIFQKYHTIWLNPVKGAEISNESVTRDR